MMNRTHWIFSVVILEDEYNIDIAHSADEALEKLENKTFHIAMTDMVMPGTDGIELLTQIKKRWPHVAVVVISGKATIGMAVEANENRC